MTSNKIETTTVPVCAVVSMTEAELALFMQEHRLPDGTYRLPIDAGSWRKLSSAERHKIARKLHHIHIPSETHSTPTQGPLTLAMTLDVEAYHELIKDGGRSAYPIRLIHEVYGRPREYLKVLRPWKERISDNTQADKTIRRQLAHWREFRGWQNKNRMMIKDRARIHPCAKKEPIIVRGKTVESVDESMLLEPNLNSSGPWESWGLDRMYCPRLFTQDCKDINDYTTAVKDRLARHGFDGPFELLDLGLWKQDTLTTWIEYFCFVCFLFDENVEEKDFQKTARDDIWQEISSKEIMESGETKWTVLCKNNDFLGFIEEGSQGDYQKAEEEEKELLSKYERDPNSVSNMERETARNKKTRAKAKWEKARLRKELFPEFESASKRLEELEVQTATLRRRKRWTRRQLDQIEAELRVEAEIAQLERQRAVSDEEGSKKRRCARNQESFQEDCSKKMKTSKQGSSRKGGSEVDGISNSHTWTTSERSHRDTTSSLTSRADLRD